MATNHNPLGLFIPAQSIEHASAPYLKPRETERWIANLPIAHIGETARLIFKAITELNRTSIPPAHRFKILELFRVPLNHVTQSLLKHFMGQAFPLSAKTQKIAELTQELQWEFANGYKILIGERIARNSKLDDKSLLISIFRAMFYISETLLKSYLIYAPSNNQAWLELNRLYLFAEHNELSTEPVKDELLSPSTPLTICTLYKKAVLLAIANPYRFSQFNIVKIDARLKDWAQHTQLHILENMAKPTGLFTIDLEQNCPPSYYNAHKRETGQYVRVVDTSELTRILRDLDDQAANSEAALVENKAINSMELDLKVIKRLILAWGAVPKRNFSRKGCHENVKVTLGLSATHYFISEQQDNQYEVADDQFTDSHIAYKDTANFSNNNIEKAEPEKNVQHDIWDLASNPNLRKTDLDLPVFSQWETKRKDPLKNDKKKESFTYQDCLLVNESAGGFCISWDNTTATKTVIGSLISVKSHSHSDSEWSIGVIRWIKAGGNNTLFIGIELISPNAQPIAAKNITQKQLADEFNRSLLLPELRSIEQPQTLITKSLYQVGDKLELDIHGQSIKVKLTKLIESTTTFRQFQFSIIRTVKKVTSQDKMDRIKNFDSIWNSI